MSWSLSEFLQLLVIRSQCWCLVELGEEAGFNVPHNDAILFYAVLDGEVRIGGIQDGAMTLTAGDIVMMPSGCAHGLRTGGEANVEILEFLSTHGYVDTPPTFRIGGGERGAKLLCSRLKVLWPAGRKPEMLPIALRVRGENALVSIRQLEQMAGNEGSVAVLSRAAALLFTAAFRDYHECESLYREFFRNDPITRAKQFMELHPFKDWTVRALARKVGMGRSNFAARFAQTVGKTPIEFLTEERMKHAARLLEKTDMKIAAVSEYVGYRSEAAFSRRFTAHYGISPGKMRKVMRDDGPEAKPDASPPNLFAMEAARDGQSAARVWAC